MKAYRVFLLVLLAQGACRKSGTVKDLDAFADRVCECTDLSCVEAVESEYLSWWEKNRTAKGSESDRKDVEKAMQRYSECAAKYQKPEPEANIVVPTVDIAEPSDEAIEGEGEDEQGRGEPEQTDPEAVAPENEASAGANP